MSCSAAQQWLGSSEPDPDNVHFDAICSAVTQMCSDFRLLSQDIHIWIDYSSIPQRNKTLQKLSIDTLSLYATACK